MQLYYIFCISLSLLHFIFEFLTQRFTFSSRHYCCAEQSFAPAIPTLIYYLVFVELYRIFCLGSVLGLLIFLTEKALRKSSDSRQVSVVKPFLA